MDIRSCVCLHPDLQRRILYKTVCEFANHGSKTLKSWTQKQGKPGFTEIFEG